jgi:uncharacterized protein with PQ loop repeat
MGTLPQRSRKRVVNPTAATAKVQDRRAISPMHLRVLNRSLALWATEAIRMQNIHKTIVTFLLIHQPDC